MHKFLIPGLLIALVAAGCGTTEDGPIIAPDVNSRNLCNYNVSVENETRCMQYSNCTGVNQACWFSPESHFNSGMDSCQSDGDCQAEGDWRCSNGWCHRDCSTVYDPCLIDEDCTTGLTCNVDKCQKPCTAVGDCDAGDFCLNSYCQDCDQEEFCTPDGLCHKHKGFCRECTSDTSCDVGLRCDHGWCHKPCTTEDDCDEAGQFCTGNFCRKAHVQGTEVNFCNDGNKDLEVYLDQVVLYGADDACVFSRFEWSQTGPTVTLPPDDCGLFLNIKFTPKDVGQFRGLFKIPSNSIRDNLNPLYFYMCGQSVEAVCSVSEDETCPECTSCQPEDFQSILDGEPVPNCDGYF